MEETKVMSTVPAETMPRIRELRAEGLDPCRIAAVFQAEHAALPGRRKAWTHTGVSQGLQQETDETAGELRAAELTQAA